MDSPDGHFSMLSGLPALAVAVCFSAGVAQAAGADTQGAWQSHQVTFRYLGLNSGKSYSRQGMIEHLAYLLTQSGAELNAPIEVSPTLTAKLNFSTFTPVTDANAGPGSSAPGTWRHVVFSGTHSQPALGYGDCQLVYQFRASVLDALTTRDVDAYLPCMSFKPSFPYKLSFQTFVPSDTPPRAVGGG